jgi:hypothetical protein
MIVWFIGMQSFVISTKDLFALCFRGKVLFYSNLFLQFYSFFLCNQTLVIQNPVLLSSYRTEGTRHSITVFFYYHYWVFAILESCNSPHLLLCLHLWGRTLPTHRQTSLKFVTKKDNCPFRDHRWAFGMRLCGRRRFKLNVQPIRVLNCIWPNQMIQVFI